MPPKSSHQSSAHKQAKKGTMGVPAKQLKAPQKPSMPPAAPLGDVVDGLLIRRAKAKLATMEATNATVVKRRLQSSSGRHQAAMSALLEGKVRPPEKLITAARGGSNPFYVSMTNFVPRKPRRNAKAVRKRLKAAKKAKESSRAKQRELHTKRQSPAAALTGSLSSSSAGRAGMGLAMAARFSNIQSAHRDHERTPGKPPRDSEGQSKHARKDEPQRKKELKERACTKAPASPRQPQAVSSLSPTKPRWTRRCSSVTIRAYHSKITSPARLRRYWRSAGNARKERKFSLHRAVSMTRLPLCFRRNALKAFQLRIVRKAHKIANADLWSVARHVVAQRRRFLRELNDSNVSGQARGTGKQSLSLARSFPLFGVVVEVMWLRFRQVKRRPNVTVRRCPTLLLKRSAIVLTESTRNISVLLLPKRKDRREFKQVRHYLFPPTSSATPVTPLDPLEVADMPTIEPRILSVRKWFPAATGTATQFRMRVRPRQPRVTSWIASVAVVRGEALQESATGTRSVLSCLAGRCL